jgi:subtilisin family serine protease
MKKVFTSILGIFLLVSLIGTWDVAQASMAPAFKMIGAKADKIDPDVRSKLNALPGGAALTVIVTLRQQADLSRVGGKSRSERQRKSIEALQYAANTSQAPLTRLLNSRRIQGQVRRFTPLWVLNGFSVTATRAVIAELALNADVAQISADDLNIVPALGTPEANIGLVSAPALWSQGFLGQGVVVANMDSGVDVSHPDLAARWRGGGNSWFDPYNQHPAAPVDLSGHGTQTMGVMVGGDAGGTTIGMAPGAQWIAVKIFNDQGASTATAIHQGFQWLLDPDHNPATADAPQVVNNSWAFGTPGCFLDFEPDLQSLRAAGILPVFAAGNGGPSSSTSYSPANNPSAFAVGAINNSSQVYAYSSRGPSTCGGSAKQVYPDVVAPGVNIRTSDLFSFYISTSGTSFAAPHVAGALALLLSAYPGLSAADQAAALTGSAQDLGAPGPDDVTGYGRVDVLAAFNWLALHPTATPLPPTATSLPPTATPLPPTATPLPPTATTTFKSIFLPFVTSPSTTSSK